ncbi:MAG: hypothetical protein QOE70_6387 [Chthoniobacter sp.]|jgi:hypothetical protein|nr:hypothetical protein [Chthoniobacter sp.]
MNAIPLRLRRAIVLLLLSSPIAFAEPARILLSEDFEATAVGEIPPGFTKTGAVAVAEDAAHSGRKSLRLEAAPRGARRITKQGAEIAALGGQHWGRLYFKVKLPTPAPVVPEGKKFAVIHSTLVGGTATSPLFNDPIEVRVLDTVLGPNGTFQFLYNVQPKQRPEFATGSKYRFRYSDEWTLAEWFIDHATQAYRFFVNGEEVTEIALHKGAGNFAGAEIPAVFDSLSFGWNNYQPAGEGFVAWIDDLALSKERIGSQALPSASGPPRK